MNDQVSGGFGVTSNTRHRRRHAHPLPPGLGLLGALLGEGRERGHLLRLNGLAEDGAEPGLVLHSAAHGRAGDEVHVALVFHVQLEEVFALLSRALVLLLKVQDVLQRDLNDGWWERWLDTQSISYRNILVTH